MQRKIRVLVGKPGLDGHDRGAKVVAAALRDAGMEVIYTGLHQTPDQIVDAAAQEDVDVVALSILSGAHMTLFPEIQSRMNAHGIGDKLLTGGGIIPPDDIKALAGRGVGRLFGPGSSTQDIVAYIREWYGARHGDAALPPLPPPPAPRAMEFTPAAAAHPAPAPARRPAGAASGNAVAAKAAVAKRVKASAPARKAKPARAKATAKSARARSAAKPARKPARKAAGTRGKSARRG